MKTTEQGRRITGIGSLPHSNIDSALEFSMRLGIPYLPQIPIRNPWEYMIPQALDGLPGIQLEAGGILSLQLDLWESQSHHLDRRLARAFETENFDEFEPLASTSGGWQPFLWELQERGHSTAKIQIAGPFTSQWAIQIKGNSSTPLLSELSGQIFRLTLARSLAMVRRLTAEKIHPIFMLDEPGLFAYSSLNPKHLSALKEINLMVQSLKKAGATVGIHCCGNTDWSAVVQTGIHLLSLDTSLSLPAALGPTHRPALESWLNSGGRFCFGVIPTDTETQKESSQVPRLVEQLKKNLNSSWIGEIGKTQKVLEQAIYTPACGLALHSISEAESVLETLVSFYETLFSN